MDSEFLPHLAGISPAAAAIVYSSAEKCIGARVRQACHAALADPTVQGPDRTELLALLQTAPELWHAPLKQTRTELVQIRLTPAELELLRELASQTGVSVSAWARSRMLAR